MNFLRLFSLCLLASLLLTNCNNDDEAEPDTKMGCTNPSSDNYDADAEEDDGSCIPWRDKFIGTYEVDQQCVGGLMSVRDLVIAATSTENEIMVSITGVTWNATITSSTTFTIPQQDYMVSGNTLTVTGGAIVNADGSVIDMDYTITQGPGSSACTADGPKK